MTYIDTHAHLYLDEFSEDLPQVMDRARNSGISHILLPNIDSSTIEPMLSVCSLYKRYCYPMIGLHPTSVNETYKRELAIVEENLKTNPDFIAIGEVGLDLYWDKTFLKEQLIAFNRQVELALEYNLPLVVHTRDAFEYLYDSLKPYINSPLKGVFHSFTGTAEEAHKLMEFPGFMLGINGVVTFKNSTLSVTLQDIPLTRLVIETDAPYLTPVPYRGKRNETSYIKYTLKKLSDVYQVPIDSAARATTENTFKVFGMLK